MYFAIGILIGYAISESVMAGNIILSGLFGGLFLYFLTTAPKFDKNS